MKRKILLLLVVLSVALMSCKKDTQIVLATTTSTENSGLLAYLLPEFEKDSGYSVDVIAVGTGKAIRQAMEGNADLIMVHARAREDQFIDEGYGVKRYGFMHNDFVILGPENDPAVITEAGSIAEVMKKIADSNSIFVSRGDDSGTHIKELAVWKSAGIEPDFKNYISAGAGMNAALNIAHEKLGYVLSDRGTYLSALNRLDLEVLYEGDEILMNPYGVIAVSKDKHPHVNSKGAEALINFLISKKGQKMIGDFKVSGKQLFIPDLAE